MENDSGRTKRAGYGVKIDVNRDGKNSNPLMERGAGIRDIKKRWCRDRRGYIAEDIQCIESLGEEGVFFDNLHLERRSLRDGRVSGTVVYEVLKSGIEESRG